ncbi:RCC1 domain-containing protein [Salinispora arenicola]|uniref:RCC1 domain-containing protein n=1 Tax=Salinispora arenicola TaxID=168697 RepID=UPI0006ACE2E0|nr:Ig-like domain repeat protein [Salinispora arenicola]
MGRFCRWAVRGADAGRVGRVIVGWFLLVVAVTVTQAVTGVWSLAAQHTPSPSSAASDTVLAWGQNNDGELGDGTTTDRDTPVNVDLPAGTEVTDVAAVGDHSLALTSAGTVLAWGQNVHGQLGDGTTTERDTPVNVDLPPGTDVTAIAAGDDHSLALTSAGTVLAWGQNVHGQLGDGTTTERDTPVNVDLPPGTDVTAIAAGDDHSLALTSAGTVLAWGQNVHGQLGDGTTTERDTPVNVDLPPGTDVTAIAAGDDHSLALTSAGTVLAWGQNDDGELGDGTTTDRDTPVNVDLPAGTEVTDVAAHGDHSLAVTSAGTVLAWGNNSSGQLGDGTTTSNSTPVDVDLPTGTEVTAIAGGDSHSLAVTSAGTVLAWGNNSSGQLGDGTTTDRDTPADVNLPTGVTITAIAAGDDHSLALTAPPTSTTTLQVTPANPTADQDITLTATVTCNVDTPTGTITLRTNGETLATVPLTTSATATHTTTLPTGTHTLTAHHTSTNTCPNSQSPPTTITINPDLPITGPTLTTTTGAATLSILAGAILIYATHRRHRPPHHHPA